MNRLVAALALAMLLMSPHPAKAEPKPGDSCSLNNAVIHSGGPEESGNGYWLVCKAGTWTGIITTDANGMASTNTPTAAAHIATKAYVDAQGGGQLNVYKADGTTLVGKFAGVNSTYANQLLSSVPYDYYSMYRCMSLLYIDPADFRLSGLHSSQCGIYNGQYMMAYFSGANCTGTVRGETLGRYGFTCTGAGTCTTGLAVASGDNLGNFTYASYRSGDSSPSGICYNGGATTNAGYAMTPRLQCGSENQSCMIK